MNQITIVPSLYSGAIALGLVAALGCGCYLVGDVHGSHKAELACANQRADANGKAVTEWQEAASNQRHLDASARQADRQATQSALNDAAAVAQKFADMHVAIVKLNPPGECTLSPEWVTAFNGAR
jgi:uncharacterized protein HemX